jgi:Type VIII secretion system (T8SS), CsgF protein
MKTKMIAIALLVIATQARAAELVHQFNSPAFNGVGYSSHVLTIEQLESQRRKALADVAKSAADQAARDAKNTNLSKFLVNVESRIYAQLSKQLADAMFADGGNSGELNFQGTGISWLKTATEVTLTIMENSGNRTEITVPIGSFAF